MSKSLKISKWRKLNMGEYIRDIVMWVVTAIVAMFAIDKTGDVNSLVIIIAPVAVTLFNLFLKSC